MPIRPPALDDRSFDDLVQEMLARLPAHVPEYADPRVGDPGRTLIELFAWLADTILYRANLIPERQRLAFLRLLGIPLRPAVPARGLVSLRLDERAEPEVVELAAGATLKGPVPFETLGAIAVVPVAAECFYKRRLSDAERDALDPRLLDALPRIYGLSGQLPAYYSTTPAFAGDAADPAGIDIARDATDGSMWIALLAPAPDKVEQVRTVLGAGADGERRVLSLGFAPALELPTELERASPLTRIPHVWEISTGREPTGGELDYLTLEELEDSTGGLTRRGVVRVVLPSTSQIGVAARDQDPLHAGLGDRPPRVEAALAERLVAWIRLRPTVKLDRFPISWLGINAVEIDQRTTRKGLIAGTSSGGPDQELQLPFSSIDPQTLVVEIEDTGGFVRWHRIDDLQIAGRDANVFELDAEAGVLRFGDDVRGRIPVLGARIRLAELRAGGGTAGNLPPGSLRSVAEARTIAGDLVTRPIQVVQPLRTEGGRDAETLAEAEKRIPAELRHRSRAVTADDFREVAAATPGLQLGRVEVLPRFKPQQRELEMPGVVSVMVLPQKLLRQPPNPRADRPLIEAVKAHLDARRPLATELYVIGCEYRPLALSVGVDLRSEGEREETLFAIREALRSFLWPLHPGGADGTGWPLGRAVRDRELEVVVAQVPGVAEVRGVRLFERAAGAATWSEVPRNAEQVAVLPLREWQLPELLAVVAVAGEDAPADPARLPNPFLTDAVAVPVVPEVC